MILDHSVVWITLASNFCPLQQRVPTFFLILLLFRILHQREDKEKRSRSHSQSGGKFESNEAGVNELKRSSPNLPLPACFFTGQELSDPPTHSPPPAIAVILLWIVF